MCVTGQMWLLQGANQAAAAAKLKHPTYMLGQVRLLSVLASHLGQTCSMRHFSVHAGIMQHHIDNYRPCENDTHDVSMGLQVGKDVNAELLKSSLSEAGVKLDHLREVDGPSGTAVILVQPSGGWSCSHAERME